MSLDVCLTDGFLRRTLAACRSLGRQGLAVTCGEESLFNATSFSRFCRYRFTYPSTRRSPEAFVTRLLEHLRRYRHECLIPMEESTLDLVLAHRSEFEQVTSLPFPDSPTFQRCRDKGQTLEMAARAGVVVPKTIHPSDPARVVEETQELRLPLIVKPRRSCAARGLVRVSSRRELEAAYRQVHERYPYPLVQEEIPQGEKLDVCCLFDASSRPVATFVQREVRGYPLLDGPSSVQESVWRPDLVELTTGMLQQAGWYGIAEAEFMVDPRDGTPVLMEVNPRFWASLQLAIFCGVDFPYLLYRVVRGERVEPVQDYQAGLMCRSLLPTDALHFLADRDRWRMQPSFFRFLDSRCSGDLVSLGDPGPLLGFFLSCLRYLLDIKMWQRMMRTGERRRADSDSRSAAPARRPVRVGRPVLARILSPGSNRVAIPPRLLREKRLLPLSHSIDRTTGGRDV